MKRVAFLMLSGCVVGLAGCDELIPKPPKDAQMQSISRLDCPRTQGDLTLAKAAADGQSCHYTSGTAQADIRLVSLQGRSLNEALAPIEADLKSRIPSHPTDPAAAAARRAEKEAENDASSDQGDDLDEVHVQVPGVSIDASDRNETADIHLPGLTVNVNGDRTSVAMGTRTSTTTSSSSSGLPVRPVPRSIDRTFIVTSDDERNSPYSLLAYTARGPANGPLAVAIIQVPQSEANKAETEDSDSDRRDLLKDAEQILKHNVGGRRTSHRAEVHIN